MLSKLALKSLFFSFFFILTLQAQHDFLALTISSDLKENANAVVRLSDTQITLNAIDRMVVKEHRIVTVFNKNGQKHVGAVLYYDDSKSIKVLEAKVYNTLGVEIKKHKKKDFLDVSVADGVSIFNDNRAKYLEYTPSNYPYTIAFILETVNSNTAFIRQRYPNRKLPFEIDSGFLDIDEYTITLPANLRVEALQDDVSIKNKFGEYQFSIKQTAENTLVFKRTLKINKGEFSKEDYTAFRKFKLDVV